MTTVTGAAVGWLLLILGVSYVVQARAWLRMVRDIMADPTRLFAMMIPLLMFGLLVVATHNVWEAGWPLVVTLFGWILVIKSGLYLVWPGFIRYFSGWTDAGMLRYIRCAGSVILVLGAGVVYRYPFAV